MIKPSPEPSEAETQHTNNIKQMQFFAGHDGGRRNKQKEEGWEKNPRKKNEFHEDYFFHLCIPPSRSRGNLSWVNCEDEPILPL